MNDEALLALLFMAAATLLPLVPSFILYRVLASTGEASGPMGGLTVKFGGPAALYIALFVVLVYIRPTDFSHYHTWTVTGQLDFNHVAGEPEPNLNDVFVRLVPPRLGVMNGGYFTWDVPVEEGPDGRLTFPDLQLDLRGYRGVTIPLGGGAYGQQQREIKRDEKERRLWLPAPIILQSITGGPAYRPQAAEPPQPITGATAGGSGS